MAKMFDSADVSTLFCNLENFLRNGNIWFCKSCAHYLQFLQSRTCWQLLTRGNSSVFLLFEQSLNYGEHTALQVADGYLGNKILFLHVGV